MSFINHHTAAASILNINPRKDSIFWGKDRSCNVCVVTMLEGIDPCQNAILSQNCAPSSYQQQLDLRFHSKEDLESIVKVLQQALKHMKWSKS